MTGFIAPDAHDGMLQFTWIACVDELRRARKRAHSQRRIRSELLDLRLGVSDTATGWRSGPRATPSGATPPLPLDDVPDAELLPAEPLLPQPAVTVATATTAIATTATRFQLVLMCTVLSPLIRTIDFVRAADAHPDGRGSAGLVEAEPNRLQLSDI